MAAVVSMKTRQSSTGLRSTAAAAACCVAAAAAAAAAAASSMLPLLYPSIEKHV
jgi:hypothetical protein